jgi:flagellar protein FlbT
VALKLKLKPHERLLINGAVIKNGGRKSEVILLNFANCLREQDILQEEDCGTPAARVYFAIQMMIMDPARRDQYKAQFDLRMIELAGAITHGAVREAMSQATEHVEAGISHPASFYKALAAMRGVLKYERQLFDATADAGGHGRMAMAGELYGS